MDLVANLASGFGAILDPGLILAMLVGVLVGTIVGVLPGIGPNGAMAILLPLSFTLNPATGLIMTAGIYLGSQYGGSTTAILVGVPGEASSVVTMLDGYPMTRAGRAGAALAVAAIGSFIAGTMAVFLLMVVARPLSEFAKAFSSAEFLLVALFALIALSRLTGGSAIRTFIAVGIGLMLATIGLDPSSGAVRFDLGFDGFIDGLTIPAVAVGLFGIAEMLLMAEQPEEVTRIPKVPLRNLWLTRAEFRRSAVPMVRGGLVGFLLGLLPGPSGVTASYASYAVEKQFSKHPEEFGKGAIEGVAGPESANNGASGGAMVPLLILGLPFNGPTALLLAGFTVHGVIPGPLFMESQPVLFWTLIAGFYAANLALLVLNLPLVGLFVSLLRIPRDLMMTLVIVIAIIGTYGTRGNMIDVFWLLVLGMLGYVLAKLDISRAAVMLAFVIGPFLESSLIQTTVLANGDPTYLLRRPISAAILALTVLVVFLPVVLRRLRSQVLGASAPELEADAS